MATLIRKAAGVGQMLIVWGEGERECGGLDSDSRAVHSLSLPTNTENLNMVALPLVRDFSLSCDVPKCSPVTNRSTAHQADCIGIWVCCSMLCHLPMIPILVQLLRNLRNIKLDLRESISCLRASAGQRGRERTLSCFIKIQSSFETSLRKCSFRTSILARDTIARSSSLSSTAGPNARELASSRSGQKETAAHSDDRTALHSRTRRARS